MKTRLYEVRYRWHTGNTHDTQIVDETTLEKMEENKKFVIFSIRRKGERNER